MCGRFTLASSGAAVVAQFALPEAVELTPRYNIAPSQPIAVIGSGANGERQFKFLRWGLIPPWAKEARIGNTMINARSESAAEKPAFRVALRKRRCLIPADGFYEWQHSSDGGKQPFYIQPSAGGCFAFGGLWEEWQGPEGAVRSCTILTTAANEQIAPFHERMPVMIQPSDYDRWLDRNLHEPKALRDLFAPAPIGSVQIAMVSSAVNRVSNDEPSLIAPISA